MVGGFSAVLLERNIEIIRVLDSYHLADPVRRQIRLNQQVLRFRETVLRQIGGHRLPYNIFEHFAHVIGR